MSKSYLVGLAAAVMLLSLLVLPVRSSDRVTAGCTPVPTETAMNGGAYFPPGTPTPTVTAEVRQWLPIAIR
jgi:hypothetical protein